MQVTIKDLDRIITRLQTGDLAKEDRPLIDYALREMLSIKIAGQTVADKAA